jgi:alkanesulfonate monooxygenase SsuD/methylene tetrahydromethanopterin reductase-like flavin-dependent oxidoreductase (luciferase family)
VDVASGGRLIFGIGVGYLKQEFDALGISFDRKGARTDEYLEAILALWTQAHPSYEGEFVRFGGVQAFPRPVQRPHPPIVVGGSTTPAFRRAVTHGNGWYGFALDADTTRRFVGELRAIEARGIRPGELGPLEISVTPAAKIDIETVRAYAEIGVDRLIFLASIASEEKALDSVRRVAAVKDAFEREP